MYKDLGVPHRKRLYFVHETSRPIPITSDIYSGDFMKVTNSLMYFPLHFTHFIRQKRDMSNEQINRTYTQ